MAFTGRCQVAQTSHHRTSSVASSTDVLVVNISTYGRILVRDPPMLDLFRSDPQTVSVCEKAGTV